MSWANFHVTLSLYNALLRRDLWRGIYIPITLSSKDHYKGSTTSLTHLITNSNWSNKYGGLHNIICESWINGFVRVMWSIKERIFTFLCSNGTLEYFPRSFVIIKPLFLQMLSLTFHPTLGEKKTRVFSLLYCPNNWENS